MTLLKQLKTSIDVHGASSRLSADVEFRNRRRLRQRNVSTLLTAAFLSVISIGAKAGGHPRAWRRPLLVAMYIVAAGLPVRPAAADEFDAFNLVAGGSVSHDSNLLRLPGFANPQSDTITTGDVGLRIDKPYAQQRFQFGVTETAYRYDKLSFLNFDALDYRGAWLWHLSPRVSGTLSAERTEALVPFADIVSVQRGSAIQRDVVVSNTRVFNLDGWISGGWHLLLGVTQLEQKSEQPIAPIPDFRSVNGETGVKYVTPSENSIIVAQRSTRGYYLNSVFDPTNSSVDGYRQDESEIKTNWMLNSKSSVTGRLTWLARHNDHLTRFDYSGLAGELDYIWAPTGKLRIEFSARRDISPYVDLLSSNSSYKVDNVLALAPTWHASEKVAVHMRLEHVQSDFRGGLVALASRSDVTNNALLGMDWLPQRSISFGATLQHQRRSSSDLLFEYDATIAGVNASLMF